MTRMSFYDFMAVLDKFCLDNQDLDFREMEVFIVNGMNLELLVIKSKKGRIIEVINLMEDINDS